MKGVSPEVIADLCRVHVTTARRWKRYGDPPYTALQLIKLFVEGELGVVDLKWANWRLREGKLVSDDRVAEFTPGEVRAIPLMRMQIANYHKEQRLPRQGDWISETWVQALEQQELAVG